MNLDSHMAIYDFVERGFCDSRCAGFLGIANLGHQAYLRRYYTGSVYFDPSGSSSSRFQFCVCFVQYEGSRLRMHTLLGV